MIMLSTLILMPLCKLVFGRRTIHWALATKFFQALEWVKYFIFERDIQHLLSFAEHALFLTVLRYSGKF